MQQTRSYWRWLTVTGVASALFASACVVTTDDPDDDNGGASGSNTAGAAGAKAGAGGSTAGAAGAAVAGAGGSTAGTGGVPYVCDDDPTAPGTPNPTCESSGEQSACTTCVETKCCAEYKECYGTDPGNQCGWGGPDDKGELACMQLCAQQALIDQGVLGDDEILACSAQCTTTKEHGSTLDCTLIGGTTSAAFNCIKDSCMVECIGEP